MILVPFEIKLIKKKKKHTFEPFSLSLFDDDCLSGESRRFLLDILEDDL